MTRGHVGLIRRREVLLTHAHLDSMTFVVLTRSLSVTQPRSGCRWVLHTQTREMRTRT